jgi:hypothetical protein
MPEEMSDRMPEDFPVSKCINFIVGITWSKVIYGWFRAGLKSILHDVFQGPCMKKQVKAEKQKGR